MHEEHPNIDTPSPDTIIWRYMDLWKFKELLATSSLFLCRIDQFDDSWEGLLPKSLQRARWNTGESGGEVIAEGCKKLRDSYFVSCWHNSKHQSEAQWEKYASVDGVAIRTTVRELTDSVISNKKFYLGNVVYTDHDAYVRRTSHLPFAMFESAFIKRDEFKSEKEVRMLHWDLPERENGAPAQSHALRADLSKLLRDLYLSPKLGTEARMDIESMMVDAKLESVSIH